MKRKNENEKFPIIAFFSVQIKYIYQLNIKQ